MNHQPQATKGIHRFGLMLLAPLLILAGCAKTNDPLIVPMASCVPDPFRLSAAGSDAVGPYGFGIVNGSIVNTDVDNLDRSTVGLVIEHAVLGSTDPSVGTCTGVLAANDIVLTAAHCFNAPAGVVQTRTFVIFKSSMENLAINDPQLVEARQVAIHPNFASQNSDVAVIRLSRPAPNTAAIASIVANPTSLVATPELAITAIGYGASQTGVGATAGFKRRTDTVVNSLVNLAMPGASPIVTYPNSSLFNQLRIRDTAMIKRGACNGDSGGPGFIKGRTEVFGLVQGYNSTVNEPVNGIINCETGDYNYTLIAPYINWIEQQMGGSKLKTVNFVAGSATSIPTDERNPASSGKATSEATGSGRTVASIDQDEAKSTGIKLRPYCK